MSPIENGFRKRTARVFENWRDEIVRRCGRDRKRGLVRTDVNPDEAATSLMAVYEVYLSLAQNSQHARILR